MTTIKGMEIDFVVATRGLNSENMDEKYGIRFFRKNPFPGIYSVKGISEVIRNTKVTKTRTTYGHDDLR